MSDEIRSLAAVQMYAESQITPCEGPFECHWCAGACSSKERHDDPYPLPFQKGTNRNLARRPANPYICRSCWLYRRPRQTIYFLDRKEYQDKQSLLNHSWLLTPLEILAIRSPQDYPRLQEILFKPPRRFTLSLLTGKGPNFIHTAVANTHEEIKADTPLCFTLDNVAMEFSVYELEWFKEEKDGTGLMPGTRALGKLFGWEPKPEGEIPPPREEDSLLSAVPVTQEEKRKGGRQAGSTLNIPNPGKRIVRG